MPQAAESAGAWRYERKFMLPLSVREVLDVVRHHPAMFSRAYPPRHVNNIYFDSPGLHNYFATVDGLARRAKVRIRWYGELFGEVSAPVLEIKRKQGLVGWKSAYSLPAFTLDPATTARDLHVLLERADLPPEASLMLAGLQPALLNRYHRCYFRSADRSFRLTLDSNMRFYRFAPLANAFLQMYEEQTSVVLELKYGTGHAAQAEAVCQAFPFRASKSSKYVRGIEVIRYDHMIL